MNSPAPECPVGAPPATPLSLFFCPHYFFVSFLAEWKSNEDWICNWPNYRNQTQVRGWNGSLLHRSVKVAGTGIGPFKHAGLELCWVNTCAEYALASWPGVNEWCYTAICRGNMWLHLLKKSQSGHNRKSKICRPKWCYSSMIYFAVTH